MREIKIKSALVSVFDKTGLEALVEMLHQEGVKLYSTGGTHTFIEKLGIPCEQVENVTGFPDILGGRVKTLHPKIFGGILYQRGLNRDEAQAQQYGLPAIDLVIVDLYPFEKTVASGASHEDIIEKIDIGGVSLIRAAAKNYNDVTVISSKDQYEELIGMFEDAGDVVTSLEQRKHFAREAFNVSSHYDVAIYNYFAKDEELKAFKQSIPTSQKLRYGENPHQDGFFHGDLNEVFDKLHGKELSYNNLQDIDAAVNLMADFKDDQPTFAILKHNNACGLATRSTMKQAYEDALAGDPVSAFGGILIANGKIDLATAELINSLFCEVVIAPSFDAEAVTLLESKKNRILLVLKKYPEQPNQFRTILNGVLEQNRDVVVETAADFKPATNLKPSAQEIEDMIFANKLVKHTKSNTIVLAKGKQLLASGTGQTSRVDALKQAIEKAKNFNFDLNGAVMASDAFFPFPDCVEIANKEGIKAVIQPGGSIKDQLSIDYCNEHQVAMVFTGNRHFKH